MRLPAALIALTTGAVIAPGTPFANPDNEQPAPPADCAAPPPDRAPDPRCGESLDGRATPPQDSAASPLLAVPRLASRAVFWPVVTTSALIERHHVVGWGRAVLTSDDGLIGLRPRFTYASGFVPTVGLTFFDRRLPWRGSEFATSIATGGSDVLNGYVTFQTPRSVGLSARGGWDHRADRLFAGAGPMRERDLVAAGRGIARYKSNAAVAQLQWARQVARPLIFDLTADIQSRTYGATDVRGGPSVSTFYPPPPGSGATVDPQHLPGFDQGLRIAHGGASATIDFLQNARDATGWQLTAGGNYAHGVGGDPSRHVTLAADTATSWGGRDRALLLRIWGAAVEKVGSAPIPFEELITPTGGHGMRGLPYGRLRGESALVGSIEYRWLIAYNLDASLFVDQGTVAGHRFSGLKTGDFFPTFGVGVRFYKPPSSGYWRAAPEGGVQLTYAPESGVRMLLSTAVF